MAKGEAGCTQVVGSIDCKTSVVSVVCLILHSVSFLHLILSIIHPPGHSSIILMQGYHHHHHHHHGNTPSTSPPTHYLSMASTTEAHSVSAKSTSDITADDRGKSGYYGVNSGPQDAKMDAKVWSSQQDDRWVKAIQFLVYSY